MPVSIRHKPIRANQAGLQPSSRQARDEAERLRPARRGGVHRRAVDAHDRVLPGESAVRVVIQNPVAAAREVCRVAIPDHGTKRSRRVCFLPRDDEYREHIVEPLEREPVIQPIEP